MVIEMAVEERGKSPWPKQKEKIEDTNETQIPLSKKKKKRRKKKKKEKIEDTNTRIPLSKLEEKTKWRKEKEDKKKSQNGEEEEGKWLKHYSSVHRILLVGEGDFSFSLSLANAFCSASNIVATSLDSFDDVIKKYRHAKSNLKNLVKLGATVLHGVDATTMKIYTNLSMRQFDRIIFNFPHAGFHGKEYEIHLIRLHRNLVQGFFKNASRMLCPSGEIHVRHKTNAPYHWWNLEELASKCSLTLTECVRFEKEDYPGYNNKRGDGPRCDKPFLLGECSTFKFRVNTLKEKKSEAKASYTCRQSLLNITETQHPRSAGVILEESQFCRARNFDGNGHLSCYPRTYNSASMQYMFGIPHRNTINFSRNDHLQSFEYQQPHHTTGLREPPRAQLRTNLCKILEGMIALIALIILILLILVQSV